MTQQPSNSRGVWAGLAEKHFLVAVIVLALTAACWEFAVSFLHVVLAKAPVPWPACVEVNEFRNVSFPTVLGSYRRLENGELPRPPSDTRPEGVPDGESILQSDVLDTLGMGNGLDKSLMARRASNWYLSRIYVDTRESKDSPYRYWRADITYYTGGLDTVPHIPENCLAAGGAQIVGTEPVAMTVAGLPAPWDRSVTFNRVEFASKSQVYAQYYVFSLNGQPEVLWTAVRGRLMDPLKRYCYFAKFQIGPLFPVADLDEANRKASDFADTMLSEVLKTLPTPQDIQQLESSGRSRK